MVALCFGQRSRLRSTRTTHRFPLSTRLDLALHRVLILGFLVALRNILNSEKLVATIQGKTVELAEEALRQTETEVVWEPSNTANGFLVQLDSPERGLVCLNVPRIWTNASRQWASPEWTPERKRIGLRDDSLLAL